MKLDYDNETIHSFYVFVGWRVGPKLYNTVQYDLSYCFLALTISGEWKRHLREKNMKKLFFWKQDNNPVKLVKVIVDAIFEKIILIMEVDFTQLFFMEVVL